jgi:hypothetical protein
MGFPTAILPLVRRSRLYGILLIAGLGLIGVAVAWPQHAPGREPQSLRRAENFTSGNLNAWVMPFPSDWEILSQSGLHYLHMKRSRPPGIPRRPLQFARIKNVRVGSFDLEARVRREGKSMLVVFNYVDTLHFYYAHLSRDPGTKISVHNGIFIVDGGPRRRIAGKLAAPALPDRHWHTVRIVRDAQSGSIAVYMDHQRQPLFHVIDRAFTCGEVGFGSFDETGDFADIRLRSDDAGCQVPTHKP